MTKQKRYLHHEVDPVTGQDQWYFPLEITVNPKDYNNDPDAFESTYEYLNSLKHQTVVDVNGNAVVCEVADTKLGFREFKAIFVPVASHEMYLELIKDEMNKQFDMKMDGRCPIPAEIGGVKTCPLRIDNPDYVEGGDMPKTIANSCDNCIYCAKKHEHTEANFSSLSAIGDDGESIDYDAPAPVNYYAGEQYERITIAFRSFLEIKAPDLVKLAEKLSDEYLRSEAARELNVPSSTAQGQRDRLKRFLLDFLANYDSI